MKLMSVIARTIGSIWLFLGICFLAAAFLSETDRLTRLMIGAFFAVAGLWFVCARNPIGALGRKMD